MSDMEVIETVETPAILPPSLTDAGDENIANEASAPLRPWDTIFITVLFCFAWASFALCLPGIVRGFMAVSAQKPPLKQIVVDDHSGIHEGARKEMRRLQTAVEGPQGQ